METFTVGKARFEKGRGKGPARQLPPHRHGAGHNVAGGKKDAVSLAVNAKQVARIPALRERPQHHLQRT